MSKFIHITILMALFSNYIVGGQVRSQLSPDCSRRDYNYLPEIKTSYKLHLEKKTWNEARKICQYEGGNLAIVRTETGKQYLSQLIKQADSEKYAFAFVGFHDLFEEGDFVTVKNENLNDISNFQWCPGQPDGKEKENCGGLRHLDGFHDYSCSLRAKFICERSENDQESPEEPKTKNQPPPNFAWYFTFNK